MSHLAVARKCRIDSPPVVNVILYRLASKNHAAFLLLREKYQTSSYQATSWRLRGFRRMPAEATSKPLEERSSPGSDTLANISKRSGLEDNSLQNQTGIFDFLGSM